MNIHLPAILMFTRGIGFWPIPIWVRKGTWSFHVITIRQLGVLNHCRPLRGLLRKWYPSLFLWYLAKLAMEDIIRHMYQRMYIVDIQYIYLSIPLSLYVYIGLSRLLELRKPEYDWGVGWGGMLTFMWTCGSSWCYAHAGWGGWGGVGC